MDSGELPSSYSGRSRHLARPWKPSTPHPSQVEQREPKGWTLSHILSKAKWSMKRKSPAHAEDVDHLGPSVVLPPLPL